MLLCNICISNTGYGPFLQIWSRMKQLHAHDHHQNIKYYDRACNNLGQQNSTQKVHTCTTHDL